jgi:hypothetical protein
MGRTARRAWASTVHDGAPPGAGGETMKTKPDADNTELDRDFEPLRVALAVGALVLGLLFGLH